MTAAHVCPGGCHRQVRSGHFVCRWCWWRLPPELRDAITTSHGRDPDAHVEAMLSALAWYREEPVERIEVVGGRYDDERETDDEREAERRVLDVVRDLFAVLDAHGYQRTSDEAALGRAVVAVWALVDEYEGQTGGGWSGSTIPRRPGTARRLSGDRASLSP